MVQVIAPIHFGHVVPRFLLQQVGMAANSAQWNRGHVGNVFFGSIGSTNLDQIRLGQTAPLLISECDQTQHL